MRMKHDHYYKVLVLRPFELHVRDGILLLLRLIIWRLYAIQHGLIDVIVGADGNTTKGDVANKIGYLWWQY